MSRSLRKIARGVAFLGLAALSAAAHAQLDVANTIKKVHVEVTADGTVQRKLVAADRIIPGDELRYQLTFTNKGEAAIDAGTIVITDHVPEHTVYVDGTASGSDAQILFSLDGERYASPEQLLVERDGEQMLAKAEHYTAVRWVYAPALLPGESAEVAFNVRLQ
ncbi:MAG: hypothetical protein AAF513_02205 [Pseudomonadota bacterium]